MIEPSRRSGTVVLAWMLAVASSAGGAASEAYVAGGHSPRENVCLNGQWRIIQWVQARSDAEYGRTLAWPPKSRGGWRPCVLPQNMVHPKGERSPSGKEASWRGVGWPPSTMWL